MRRLILFVLGCTFLTATTSQASSFSLGSVDVTLRNVDPGLVLWWQALPSDDWNFSLSERGDEHTAALFKIGTKEEALNVDDIKPYDVEVLLSLASPAITGSVDGISGAAWLLASVGYVVFDNPLHLAFGTNGLLQVTLTHALFGLPGKDIIYGNFKLLRPDSGVPTAVPEAASLTLLGIALAAATVRARSRKFVA